MSESSILQSNNYLEKYAVDYSLAGGSHLWTKSSMVAQWDSMVLGKKCISVIGEDQSVRGTIHAIDKRLKFGFASINRRFLNVGLTLGWEFVPDLTEATIFEESFSTNYTNGYNPAIWEPINGLS